MVPENRQVTYFCRNYSEQMGLKKEFEKQGVWLFRYRGQLPVIILMVQFAIHYFALDNHSLDWENSFTWNLICLAVCLFGQAIRIMVIGYTPRNTSGRNTKAQVAEVVNQTGIYSVVRHPLYLGNFFMWLGISMLSQNYWFITVFILVFWLFYERIMYAEEAFLRKSFGEPYKKWADRVPAFIPAFHGWVPSSMKFSSRNILKRESVGFFNVFLVFWLFSLESQLVTGTGFNPLDSWFLGFLIVALLTAIIWLVRKKTKWLVVEGR